MALLEPAVVAVKTVTVLLGGLITVLAVRAARRTGSRPLGHLAVGFGIVTLGAVLAGTSNLVFHVDLVTSVLLESAVTAVGFAVITYSLFST